jgi:hypothetical protein
VGTRVTRFRDDERGTVAVVMALAIIPVLGMTGLAIETGLWYAQRRNLQTAADAGALGAAFEIAAGGSNLRSAATMDAGRNGFSAGSGSTIAVNNPPLSGPYAGSSLAVEVIVTRQQTLLLSSLFLNGPMTVKARAVANAGTPGDSCILALDKVASDTAYFTGSATVNLYGCGITANSVSPQALAVSGSADVSAQFIQTAGGYSVSGSGTLTAGEKLTNAAQTTDPYADLTAPAAGSCTSPPGGKDFTLNPGTYCGGLSLQGDVTLNPGVYVINGGTLKMNAQANVIGSGVTIILTGNSSIGYADVDINGGATVGISAPTSGTWAGIAFYGDRRAPIGGTSKFNGGSTTNFTGALYFPSQEVDFTGGNKSDGSGCTRIVADVVKFTGNSEIGNSCTGTGVPSGSKLKPALVE